MGAKSSVLDLSQPFDLRLTMLSDWHVGSGMGRPGNVDRLVVRDEDGFPYVPAKTLVGIWRDACERLAWALDGGQSGGWSEWVKYLFGDQPARQGETDPSQPPRPAALMVRSARLGQSLRSAICAQAQYLREFQEALTFVKPGVQIDPNSGRAQDEHVRFVEMGRADTVLEAKAELRPSGAPMTPEQEKTAGALLVASAKLVERLGGKRRRGAGKCRLELMNTSLDTAIEWLETHPDPPAVPDRSWTVEGTASRPAPGAPACEDADWVSIPYVLTLQSPVNISAQTAGNVIETLDFVPGTFLLPHITAALEELGIDARPWIARGDLRVLPATVEIDGSPGRPVPLALYQKKDLYQKKEGGPFSNPQTLLNRLVEDEPSETEQFKQCRSGYLGDSQGQMPRHQTVRLTSRTHNTVEEQTQRPTPEVGGVYTYEAIAPCRLRGEIRLRKCLADSLIQKPEWKEKFSRRCALGRSKKDDYGAASFSIDLPSDGVPLPVPQPPGCQTDQLFVWVLSDVLLRDERLRFSPTVEALRKALEVALAVKLTVVEREGKQPLAFVRMRRIESWNTAWGLPRPSLVGLQAGSCVLFKTDPIADPEKQKEFHKRLQQVEAAGIGERTAEGFGQIRFNDPFLTRPMKELPAPPETNQKSVETSEAEKTCVLLSSKESKDLYSYAQRIEEVVWRERIRRRALEIAHSPCRAKLFGWSVKNDKPPMSQLGALRGIVHQVQSWTDRQMVCNWLAHLKEIKKRGDKWPKESLDILQDLFQQPNRIWQELEGDDQWPTLTENGRNQLRTKLWALAVRSLIDAAIRAHKRELDLDRQGESTRRE